MLTTSFRCFRRGFPVLEAFHLHGESLAGMQCSKEESQIVLGESQACVKGQLPDRISQFLALPALLKHRWDVLIFFFPRFSPPSAFVLPVNNFPDTCECLVLLLQSPLHPRAVLSPFSFFWHRFRPATVVSAALCLLGSLPLFLDVCRCSCFPSLFFSS